MRRLIDADICIEKIKNLPIEYDAETVQRCIEVLSNASTIDAVPQWIPCSERLPEEETDVLICNSTGDIAISRGSYSTEASDWIWYTSGWRFGEVIAWMPLPEPYEVKE